VVTENITIGNDTTATIFQNWALVDTGHRTPSFAQYKFKDKY